MMRRRMSAMTRPCMFTRLPSPVARLKIESFHVGRDTQPREPCARPGDRDPLAAEPRLGDAGGQEQQAVQGLDLPTLPDRGPPGMCSNRTSAGMPLPRW